MEMAAVIYETTVKPPRPSVLVVEDDVLIRLFMSDELRSRGYTVLEASSGEEAVLILQSSTPVQLLFTDIQLRGLMNGLQLAGHARSLRPEMKVIVTSGQAHKGPPGNLADDFVGKPYDVIKVVSKISILLGLDKI